MSTVERGAIEQFLDAAMNRGIIPMHVAADLSQYLDEWLVGGDGSEEQTIAGDVAPRTMKALAATPQREAD